MQRQKPMTQTNDTDQWHKQITWTNATTKTNDTDQRHKTEPNAATKEPGQARQD